MRGVERVRGPLHLIDVHDLELPALQQAIDVADVAQERRLRFSRDEHQLLAAPRAGCKRDARERVQVVAAVAIPRHVVVRLERIGTVHA